MKTKLLLILLLSFSFYLVSSQVPQGFNYMAIARDEAGNVLPDMNLNVRITVLSSIDPLGVIWEEDHKVKTNSTGLFQLIIGSHDATPTGDGTAKSFEEIDWTILPIFVRTSIYIDPKWVIMGDAQLFSVPYAMVTKSVSGLNKLAVAGTTIDPAEALFEVKNKLNQTVFAVYSDGVRINVGDRTAKGVKGGFAIGGFESPGKAGTAQEFMSLTPYAARININDPIVKGAKGGFAIGGFGTAKGTTATEFMNVTPLNYFIGYEAGLNNNGGINNVFIGNQSGKSNITGNQNQFIGLNAGQNNTAGSYNVFMGPNSGFNNSFSYYNTFIGVYSGYFNTSASFNTYMGCNAGFATNSGSSNTFLGTNSGRLSEKGNNNTFVGTDSGEGGPADTYNPTTTEVSNSNTAIGVSAGNMIEGGDNNVYLGAFAGAANILGSGNVFIGYQAGDNESGSNKLYIANASGTPLIGGNFTSKTVGINCIPTTYTLEVAGSIWANGSTISAGSTTWSDARFKTNINTITNALSDLCSLRGVTYDWDNSNSGTINFPEGQQVGVIAQEVEKVFPELVMTGKDGYKSVSYEKMSAIIIEAVKEQQKLIEKQQTEIDELKTLVKKLSEEK
jgi:hypothetical protein